MPYTLRIGAGSESQKNLSVGWANGILLRDVQPCRAHAAATPLSRKCRVQARAVDLTVLDYFPRRRLLITVGFIPPLELHSRTIPRITSCSSIARTA